MKYTININQKSIVERGLDLDVIDAVILSFLADFSQSEVIITIEENGTKFHWFSHEKIIQELPILQLKKDSVFRRLKRLSEKGFLLQSSQSQRMGRSFYSLTELTTKTFGFQSVPSDENPKGSHSIRRGRKQSELPSENNPKPSDEIPTDKTIINNSTNDKLFSEENVLPVEEEKNSIYSEAVKVYFRFYEDRNGVAPKFDSADGKSLKSILAYFKSLHKKKNDGSTERDFIVGSLKFVFDNWESQVDFIRNQTKMTQINSNLNNIINRLKNGKSTSNSNKGKQGNKIVGKTRKFTVDDFVKTSDDSSE